MDFYATGIKKLISHWQKCVDCNGSYFLIHKDVSEPIYNNLKFTVSNCNYFFTNLIPCSLWDNMHIKKQFFPLITDAAHLYPWPRSISSMAGGGQHPNTRSSGMLPRELYPFLTQVPPLNKPPKFQTFKLLKILFALWSSSQKNPTKISFISSCF